jgi:alpha-N-arabinofuranosidase
MTTISPILSDPIGTISPRLYGHFAEHLGRCCYDGLWMGTGETRVPTTRGFRTDVIEALKAMPTPMLRWPGGCYADHYHWRDGIGPSQDRPVRLGMSCGLLVEDDNSLGTHEFLDFCELIGAEPYLAGNMGSGSVQEMCDWLEYCNATIKTKLKLERAQNGRDEPFGVKLWGVGNENWGCGGNYSAESYGLEFRRYATMLRQVDEKAELVACGFDDHWNRKLMETLRHHVSLVDHFSIHRYWVHGGPGIDFTERQYYRLLEEADDTEKFIVTTREILDAVSGTKKIGIALDEWGVWHPEARPWGPDTGGTMEDNYEQACTVRDAIATSAVLEVFHRQCKELSLANLAQIVNVLHAPISTSANGGAMWLTPTYFVLQLHTPHIGAEALRTDAFGPSLPFGGRAITATSSRKDGKIAVTVTNRHLSESQPVTIKLEGNLEWAKIMVSDAANAENSEAQPNRVQTQNLPTTNDSSGIQFTMPPHSVATLVFTS